MPSLLSLRRITKRYPGVTALEDVAFSLEAGEVHCLVGENGAGKSTLIKILSGAIRADEGEIAIDGGTVRIDSPIDAQRQGIGTIYQDFKLVPELSAVDNITLGREPLKGVWRMIDRAAAARTASATLQVLGESMNTTLPVRALSVAQQQVVEIAKALSRKVRILALDEPTAPLTGHEIDNLFRVIRRLKSEGVGIIYISHRLEEIFEIGDRITVLRDGRNVACAPAGEADRRTLIRWMVGREMENEYPDIERARGDELFRIRGLSTSAVHDIDLELYTGEVLGIAGLVGAGRTELARAIFGADPKNKGTMHLRGVELSPRSPHEAIQAGIGFLTEDRNRLGLVLQMKVRENISLAGLDRLMGGWFIDRKKEEELAQRHVAGLNLRPPFPEMEVDKLSGGNRQKVILGRWLSTGAKLLIFDEPTAGIDVGAKYEIYTIIGNLAREGIGVIVISSDLPELLGICDRIAVMCEGRITGVLSRTQASQEAIMHLATQRSSEAADRQS